MIDPFKATTASKAPERPTHHLQIDLSGLEVDQLLELRLRLDNLLPVRSLRDMNLERELVLQVQALQTLQMRVMSDDTVPANQQAQVANALSAALSNLIKLQSDIHNSERLKIIESVLIETVKTLPMDAQEKFFDEYERSLKV